MTFPHLIHPLGQQTRHLSINKLTVALALKLNNHITKSGSKQDADLSRFVDRRFTVQMPAF